jgi:hypothetical protein
MGSQLIVVRWCDILQQGGLDPIRAAELGFQLHEERVSGEQRTYGLDKTWYLVDLCDHCDDSLGFRQLRFLVDQRIALSEKKAKATPRREQEKPTEAGDGRAMCIWCWKSYSVSTSLRAHLREDHGFKDVAEAFGPKCPVCPMMAKRLGSHVTKSHPEFAHISAAFVWAKENGDPQGAFAARLAAGKNVVEQLVA